MLGFIRKMSRKQENLLKREKMKLMLKIYLARHVFLRC